MLLYRRTPPWRMASFSPVHLICLIVICLAIWPSAAKGGRGGGGGRGSGSRGGGSRGGGWGSSRGSGSRTSRWGSSQPSGTRNSYGSRPSYSAGAAYRAPSKTMSRISANSSFYASGASNSSYPRAQAHIPAASGPTIRIVYTPVYGSYTSYKQGYSGTNMAMVTVGGNALGSTMSRLYSGYGYEKTGGYAVYVPYRDRYHDYLTTTTPGPTTTDIYETWRREQMQMVNCMHENSFDECYYTTTSTLAPPKPKLIDLCILARWNREVPYTEVPNMALMFLANDTISGNTTSDKAKFTYEFFKELPRAYASYNSSADIFTIPESYDLKKCNMQPTEGVDVTQNATESVEEPILTAARNIIMLYSNISETADNLPDVVAAAKACLPRTDNVYPPYPKILPCLQYSLAPDQLPSLNEAKSVFGNGEVCRKQLNLDVDKCLPTGETAGDCRLEHLVALSIFARNYYLCPAELEEDTVTRIRERSNWEHAEYQDWLLYGSGSNLSLPHQRPTISCYECTSGVNDGCDDPARVSKYATACPEGTQGCLTMKARGSPFIRSCGNPRDSPVPIRDGCVNKPGIGVICSCSSASLCNGGDTPSSNPLNNTKQYKPEAAQSSTAAINAEQAFGNTVAARISELPEEARAVVKTKIRDLLTRYENIYLRADSTSSNHPLSAISADDHIPRTTTYRSG